MKDLLSILAIILMAAYINPSRAAHAEKTPEMVEIVKANWKVGLDMYTQILNEHQNKNLFFSPYGLTTSLLCLHRGAKGVTATNIAQELGITTLNDNHMKAQSNIYKTIKMNEGKYDLHIAKKFYFDKSIHVLPEYTTYATEHFDIVPENVEFKNPAEVTTKINQFASVATDGKITDLVTPGLLKGDEKFLIASAVDFKGYWLSKFDSTMNAPFTKMDGTSIPTQKYMVKTGVFNTIYDPTLKVKMLEIPYRTNHHAVYIVLPDDPSGLTAFETGHLKTEILKSLLAKLKPMKMNVQVPTFKIKTHYELSSELKTMGVTDALNPGTADFSGIDAKNKFALNVFALESRLDFDDDGDETPLPGTATNKDTQEFVANHPFLFAIICKHTNVPFFLGKYTGIHH